MNFRTKVVKTTGRFTYKDPTSSTMFNIFQQNIPEGATVEIYLEVIDSRKANTAQIAKVQSMLRRLAKHTGDSFQDTKNEIKERCGLRISQNEFRSFGDASEVEIELCIEELRRLAIVLEYPLD